MGPAKGRQRVLKSALIMVGALVVAWVTWERSCFLGVYSRESSPPDQLTSASACSFPWCFCPDAYTLLCWSISLHTFTQTVVTWTMLAAIWFAIEGLFWVYKTYRYHKLNSMAQYPPTDDVQVRIEQFLTLAGVLDIKEFLSGWFMSVPFELLNREQVLVRSSTPSHPSEVYERYLPTTLQHVHALNCECVGSRVLMQCGQQANICAIVSYS